MKYYKYVCRDAGGIVRLSDDEIFRKHWQKYARNNGIIVFSANTQSIRTSSILDDCVQDWVRDHWAWEDK